MAHANQIMLVKTIKRRLNELLSDTGIKTVVKYTSADDVLTVTFRKISKGSAQLLDRKTTLQEYLLGTDILSSLTSEAIEAFTPRWTARTLMNELDRRVEAYAMWNGNDGSRQTYYFGHAATINGPTASGLFYSVCGDCGLRSSDDKATLDEIEQQFEQHAGEASHGEYTRWRAAGEPKTRQPDVVVASAPPMTFQEFLDRIPMAGPPVPVMGSPWTMGISTGRASSPMPHIGNVWAYGPSHTERVSSMQQVELDSEGRPTTLMGLPIIWDCNLGIVEHTVSDLPAFPPEAF